MKLLLLSFVATLLLAFGAFAQKGNKAEIFSNKAGAIKGYDPVAYFSDHQPIKGKDEVTFVKANENWLKK